MSILDVDYLFIDDDKYCGCLIKFDEILIFLRYF